MLDFARRHRGGAGRTVQASRAVAMRCSFSGQLVPTDKLFVLYYPPAAAHETFDKSFYAAARAREALGAVRESLESFFRRFVVTRSLATGIAALIGGIALLAVWGSAVSQGWDELGIVIRYLPPLGSLVLLHMAKTRLTAFWRRLRVWRDSCEQLVASELASIRSIVADLPEDPDAEEAAAVMRRECPESISELAFFGSNFRAFTYLDFVLSPKLRHPAEETDLPQAHSRYRDAYYVGEVVYDNWRMFNKNRHLPVDPRFVGSGGRRGVI